MNDQTEETLTCKACNYTGPITDFHMVRKNTYRKLCKPCRNRLRREKHQLEKEQLARPARPSATTTLMAFESHLKHKTTS